MNHKKICVSAIAAIIFGTGPAASQDEDAPHRIAIERLGLSGDPIDAGSCAVRLLSRSAKVTTYPVRNGVGLDWTPKSGLFMSAPGDPNISMEFKTDGQGAYLTVKYRRPFSKGAALSIARKTAKVCFEKDWVEEK